MFRDAKLVSGVSFKFVVGHQRLGNVYRKRLRQPPLDVNRGKLSVLMFRMLFEFSLLARKIGSFTVSLARHRNILTCRHRHRPGNNSGNPSKKELRALE